MFNLHAHRYKNTTPKTATLSGTNSSIIPVKLRAALSPERRDFKSELALPGAGDKLVYQSSS